MRPIGEIINEIRKAKGMTQEQLGSRLGISGQAVSKWECGDTMPDILILSDLCEVLDISLDEILDIPADRRNKNVMRDFCRYGNNSVLVETMSRMYNDSGTPLNTPCTRVDCDGIRIYDPSGIGFVMTEKACMPILAADPAKVASFLKVLTDENCLRVLAEMKLNEAKTKSELCQSLGIDEGTLSSALLDLMERGIVCFAEDSVGKTGYLQGENIVGVMMALAGCRAANFGGEIDAMFWMCRS